MELSIRLSPTTQHTNQPTKAGLMFCFCSWLVEATQLKPDVGPMYFCVVCVTILPPRNYCYTNTAMKMALVANMALHHYSLTVAQTSAWPLKDRSHTLLVLGHTWPTSSLSQLTSCMWDSHPHASYCFILPGPDSSWLSVSDWIF